MEYNREYNKEYKNNKIDRLSSPEVWAETLPHKEFVESLTSFRTIQKTYSNFD
jgi:hypothetical protein